MALTPTYPVRPIRRATGWPRGSLYREANPPDGAAGLRQALRRLAGARPTYGYRRLTAMRRREGRAVNGQRVRRPMAELGTRAEAPARRVRTTDSAHAFPRYPNLAADLEVVRPDRVWVAGITYVRLRAEFVSLAVLMDVVTRCARGWELSRALDQTSALGALERALRGRRPEVRHSDRGVQYAATAHVERLAGIAAAVSMAAAGAPEGTGSAERLMRTIKEEEVELSDYQDYVDARRQLGRFLDAVSNRTRIHSSLGYLTPKELEQQWLKQQPNGLAVP
jgi:putative transposase